MIKKILLSIYIVLITGCIVVDKDTTVIIEDNNCDLKLGERHGREVFQK